MTTYTHGEKGGCGIGGNAMTTYTFRANWGQLNNTHGEKRRGV